LGTRTRMGSQGAGPLGQETRSLPTRYEPGDERELRA